MDVMVSLDGSQVVFSAVSDAGRKALAAATVVVDYRDHLLLMDMLVLAGLAVSMVT